MTTACQSAEQCPNPPTLVARLALIGDRPMCRDCFDRYVLLGMDIRELRDDVVPAWRTRDLSRDTTGRVRGAA